MVEAFLVALAVFICVGGAELAGFTMLKQTDCNRTACRTVPGRFINRSDCRRSVGSCFYGSGKYRWSICGGAGIATAVGTAFAIMMGKGSGVALTLALPIGILGLQI